MRHESHGRCSGGSPEGEVEAVRADQGVVALAERQAAGAPIAAAIATPRSIPSEASPGRRFGDRLRRGTDGGRGEEVELATHQAALSYNDTSPSHSAGESSPSTTAQP